MPRAYAQTQDNLGLAYWRLSQLRDKEANLQKAVAAFLGALEGLTPVSSPVEYAGTHLNLGVAYDDLAQVREKGANLEKAIGAYEVAARVFDRSARQTSASAQPEEFRRLSALAQRASELMERAKRQLELDRGR